MSCRGYFYPVVKLIKKDTMSICIICLLSLSSLSSKKNPIKCQILDHLIVIVDILTEKGLKVIRRCAERTSVKCLLH